MFCHAAVASFAMLTPQGLSDHAGDTEIALIKLPQGKQFIYDCLLLGKPAKLWNKPGLVNHCAEIEITAKTV